MSTTTDILSSVTFPITVDLAYAFDDAIRSSIAVDASLIHIDLGPVDTMNEEQLAAACDKFFGTSPLSSPPSSSPPSPMILPTLRSDLPLTFSKEELDASFGTSPLSSVPSSPQQSRPPSPAPRSPPTPPLPCPPASQQTQPPFSSLGFPSTFPPPPSSLLWKPHPASPASTTQPLHPPSFHNTWSASSAPGAPSLPEPSHPTGGNSKSRRNRQKSHANRCQKRKEERAQIDKNAITYVKAAKHVANAAVTRTDYDTRAIPSALTGFVATSDAGERSRKVHTLEEILSMDGGGRFRVIPWDGGSARAIVDKDGRVIAVLAGRPNDPGWPSVHRSAHAALQSARKRCRFFKKSRRHRRGNFPALSAGISLGPGQEVPGNLQHNKANAKELALLMSHPSFKRIAGFGSKAFLSWAPRLHKYYKKNLDDLLGSNSKLRRNFDNSVWAAAAFNFGPQTCALKHRDFANLPFGWCSITALGNFDPTKGGHLILWELNLVVEFPPGATILIPSAAISHSNTAIGRGESRCSFTQYSAGGLFRWMSYGEKTRSDFLQGLSDAEKECVAFENEARCRFGLSHFSMLDEIKDTYQLPTS